jgi:hypothetical protein
MLLPVCVLLILLELAPFGQGSIGFGVGFVCGNYFWMNRSFSISVHHATKYPSGNDTGKNSTAQSIASASYRSGGNGTRKGKLIAAAAVTNTDMNFAPE